MLTDKRRDKLENVLGKETIKELEAMSVAQLETRVSQAESSILQAKTEMEANPKYEELRDSLSALKSGFNDVKKRQRAITEYALHLREDKGAK